MIITMWSERGYRVVTQRSSKFSKSQTTTDIVVVNQVLQIMPTQTLFYEFLIWNFCPWNRTFLSKNEIFKNFLTQKSSFFIKNSHFNIFHWILRYDFYVHFHQNPTSKINHEYPTYILTLFISFILDLPKMATAKTIKLANASSLMPSQRLHIREAYWNFKLKSTFSRFSLMKRFWTL